MFHTNLVRYMRIKEKTPKDFYNNKDPRLNISESKFHRIKSGKAQPSTSDQVKIARVLGVEPLELMKHEPKKKVKAHDRVVLDASQSELEAIFSDLDKHAEVFIRQLRREIFVEKVKFVIISILGFIAVSAWFLMVYVALLSNA